MAICPQVVSAETNSRSFRTCLMALSDVEFNTRWSPFLFRFSGVPPIPLAVSFSSISIGVPPDSYLGSPLYSIAFPWESL